MQTPEKLARLIADECVEGYCDRFYLEDAADLIRARDAEVRADERGRCSVVHATLTDEALVGELVRRGVLREVRVRDNRICRCYAPCEAHEPIALPTRYVTEWEPIEGGA